MRNGYTYTYTQYIETGECTYMCTWPGDKILWIVNAFYIVDTQWTVSSRLMQKFIEEDNPTLVINSIYDLKIV